MEQLGVDQLYKVILDQQIVLNKINENCQQKLNTILLIGDTGSGKSFLFNWISGAEFKFVDYELQLIQTQDQKFSAQSSAMSSVTYIPNFNQIDDDHIIIDFPGFKDTKGKYSQLSIKLMFDEIVTKTNVKIAVVIPQPTKKLEERGAHIQDLIKSAFKSQNTTFDSIGLIINQFQDFPHDEQQTIKQIREQILQKAEKDKEYAHVYRALSKSIIIVEDICDENFSTVLSDDARNSVISRLKTISAISYKPDYQDDSQVVGSYITQELKKIFTSYQKMLQKKKEDAKLHGLQQCLDNLKGEMKQMDDISQDDCNLQTEYIKNLIVKLEQSKDKKESQQKFLSIFKYFFKYKESISGYQSFEDSKKQLRKSIKQFIHELEEEQQRKKEKEQKEKQILDEIKAKHEREAEIIEHRMEEQNNKFEKDLIKQQLKEKDNLLKLKEEELKKANNEFDQKIKQNNQLLQTQMSEYQSIQAQKQEQQKKQEEKKSQLKSQIFQAETKIIKLNKDMQEYIDDQKKNWFNPKDYNDVIKKFKDDIQQQQDIINQSKNELIYQY